MTGAKELDPGLFLTTLRRWNQRAFFEEVARGPGALAALQVVPRERNAPRGAGLNEALGGWIAGIWPRVVEALATWPGAAAQRGNRGDAGGGGRVASVGSRRACDRVSVEQRVSCTSGVGTR